MTTERGQTSYYEAISRDIWALYHNRRTNVTERSIPKENGRASFEDFANALVDNYLQDSHFWSYYSTCKPCDHDYDYIIKFETLKEDIAYLKDFLHIPDEYEKAFFDQSYYNTKEEETRRLFGTIPKELGRKLYDKYALDFKMFGYSKPDYI